MSAARVCGRRETSGEGKQCTRRGGRHFEEANSGGKFSFPWVFGVARKYREAKRVKGGNETWTWLSSQVDDVYRSRKKILQVVMATILALFFYIIFNKNAASYPRSLQFLFLLEESILN